MNGFRRKKIKLLTLSEKLRKIRSDKRASFSDISKNTMIQVEYLEYLECGEYDKLPADVYVKGFLRSLAEYLGADERDLIKSFQKEKSIQKNLVGSNNKKKERKINLSKFYVTPKIISVVLISMLFLGLSFYLYTKIDSFVATPELVITTPEKDGIVKENQTVVRGKTGKGNKIFVNNQPVVIDEDGFFNEKIILKNGINVITVKSVNRFGKENKSSVSVDAQYDN